MEGYLKKVEEKAKEYLKNLGFDEQTTSLLVNQGIKDLSVQLEKLKSLSSEPEPNLEDIADTSHTIKGLLANLGLQEEGMKFKEIQLLVFEGKEKEEVINALKKLLEEL